MPQQDYVKAARPQPRSRKKAKTPAPVPKLLIAVVMLLVLVFGYFLWHISHRPGAEAAAAAAKAAAAAEAEAIAAKKPQDELPVKPSKEPYTYIKELETKEVKVTAAELAAKAPGNMTCGVFKALEGAQQMKAKIAFAGVSTEIKESNGKYRVVAGPYSSKRQATADKNLLKRQKIADCWVY